MIIMPRKTKLKLPPLNLGTETIGERLCRLRKERGYTQSELALKMGIIQVLVSDYENDKLRLHADMLARFAITLDVSSDEIIGLASSKSKTVASSAKLSLKLTRRLARIDILPDTQQKALLHTIDMFLKGAESAA